MDYYNLLAKITKNIMAKINSEMTSTNNIMTIFQNKLNKNGQGLCKNMVVEFGAIKKKAFLDTKSSIFQTLKSSPN